MFKEQISYRKQQRKLEREIKKRKEFDIDSNVISAKFGNKDSFNSLWKLYKPITIRNVDRFCNLVKGFDQYRSFLLYESYNFFWEIIKEYEIGSDICFSYYLDIELLNKTKQKIKGKNLLPLELIDDEKLRSYRGYRSELQRSKLNDLRVVLKKLSPKQLNAIYLYNYEIMNQFKAAEKMGISQIAMRERLMYAYSKITKHLKKIAWNKLTKKQKMALNKLRRKNKELVKAYKKGRENGK